MVPSNMITIYIYKIRYYYFYFIQIFTALHTQYQKVLAGTLSSWIPMHSIISISKVFKAGSKVISVASDAFVSLSDSGTWTQKLTTYKKPHQRPNRKLIHFWLRENKTLNTWDLTLFHWKTSYNLVFTIPDILLLVNLSFIMQS